MAYSLHNFHAWRDNHAQLYFLGLVASGSLLTGSSIAYPMLSQDGSGWASVALAIFFPSAGLFNTLKTPEIYMYGHYTLMSCLIATVVVMAFGHTGPLPDHAKFIPVYTMGSTFLTAAWPSLFQSVGWPLRTMDEMSHPSTERHGYLPVPMDEVVVDDNGNQEDVSPDVTSTSSEIPAWLLQERERQSVSLAAVSTAPSSLDGQEPTAIAQPPRNELPPQDLIHMGPSSVYSRGASSVGGTSISLSAGSDSRCPSEMSSIVAASFFPESRPLRRISTRVRTEGRRLVARRPEFPLIRRDSSLDRADRVSYRSSLSI